MLSTEKWTNNGVQGPKSHYVRLIQYVKAEFIPLHKPLTSFSDSATSNFPRICSSHASVTPLIHFNSLLLDLEVPTIKFRFYAHKV